MVLGITPSTKFVYSLRGAAMWQFPFLRCVKFHSYPISFLRTDP